MSKVIYSKEFIEKVEFAFSSYPEIVQLVKDQDFMVGTAIDNISSFQSVSPEQILNFDTLEDAKSKAREIMARKEVAKEWNDKFGKELLNLRYDIHDEEE